MKKKFFGSLAVLAIAAVAAFNVNVNTQENGLSDVSLDNVEALASESISAMCSGFPTPVVCFWMGGVAYPSGYLIYAY